jgi:asparagine synthase (glutamine-hydrolysing)
MIRWFCGFLSRVNLPKSFPNPVEGKNIWGNKNPFWICGPWQKCELRIITEGSFRLALIGNCLVSDSIIVETLKTAIRKNEYSELALLRGNYNVVLQNENNIYIFTDISGLRPIFYYVSDSFIIYSSCSVAIQQLLNLEVDPSWLATNLIYPMPELLYSQSPFQNVQVIPVGHYLQVTLGEITCRKYWSIPDGTCDLQQSAKCLRDQLLAAIEGRTSFYDKITSDLSGGMDSTSLALLAAKRLTIQNRELDTITIESRHESEDINWAKQAASFYPNILPKFLKSHELPVTYSNLEEIPLTDEPAQIANDMGRFLHIMEAIRSKKSQLHMTGDGGDAIFCVSDSYLADILTARKLKKFSQHSTELALLRKCSPLALIINSVLLCRTPYRSWLLQQARQLKKGQNPNEFALGWSLCTTSSMLYPQESVNLVSTKLQKYATTAIPFSKRPGQHNSVVTIYDMGRYCRILQQLGDTYGVNLSFPYLDSPIINACLNSRVEERTTPTAFKQILCKALYQDLPEIVLTRTTKGDYTADMIDGIKQNLDTITELFQNSRLADMSLINLKEFYDIMKNSSSGIIKDLPKVDAVIATEFWLRRLKKDNNTFFSPQQCKQFQQDE